MSELRFGPVNRQQHDTNLFVLNETFETVVLLDGRSGGQDIFGGTGAGETLKLLSTSHATKGYVNVGNTWVVEQATRNCALNDTSPNFQSGQGILYLKNRTAAPAGNPSSGGYLFADSGALKWHGSAGTITTLATA